MIGKMTNQHRILPTMLTLTSVTWIHALSAMTLSTAEAQRDPAARNLSVPPAYQPSSTQILKKALSSSSAPTPSARMVSFDEKRCSSTLQGRRESSTRRRYWRQKTMKLRKLAPTVLTSLSIPSLHEGERSVKKTSRSHV